MAINLDSIAARLGGQTGQGIGSAANDLNDLIRQRVADLRTQRLQEDQRQNIQKFAEARLPEELQDLAQGISYGSPGEREQFYKMLGEAQQNKAFNRLINGENETGGLPVDVLSSPSLPEKVEAPALQALQRRSQPFIPQAQQNQAQRAAALEKEQAQQERSKLPAVTQALQNLGDVIAPQQEQVQKPVELPFDMSTPESRQFFESLGLGTPEQQQKFQQEVANAPIQPDLPPEERRKAAVDYMALSNILNNPEIVAQPDQLNELGAISATLNNKKASLMDYLADGGISPDNYLKLRQLQQKQDYEGRQWVQKNLNEAYKEKEQGRITKEALNEIESLLSQGATVGSGQAILKAIGIDPVIYGNDQTQILNKLLNELVAQSSEFNSGKSSNLRLGVIKGTKPEFWTKPDAMRAIAAQFRHTADLKEAKADAWDDEVNLRTRTGRPMDGTIFGAVDRRLAKKRYESAQEMRKMWKKLGISLPEPDSISEEAYIADNPALVPLNKVPNGSRVRYKNREFVVNNGKLTVPRGQ